MVQHAFYTDPVLLKAFNGVKLASRNRSDYVVAGARVSEVSVRMGAAPFPGMTVKLSKTTFIRASNPNSAVHHETTTGYLELNVEGVMGFEIGVAREIFGAGREAEDFGKGTDGGHGAPSSKGTITYELANHVSNNGMEMGRTQLVIFAKRDPIKDAEDPFTQVRKWTLKDGDIIRLISMSAREQ